MNVCLLYCNLDTGIRSGESPWSYIIICRSGIIIIIMNFNYAHNRNNNN